MASQLRWTSKSVERERGVVQIPGFYDDVDELAEDEAAAWEALGFDEKRFLAEAGLEASTGEEGRSVLERLWSRPTCDLNGIWGGAFRLLYFREA